ncbi:MAG: competence/damage-inducible protein A [Bryobacteraceae bacterium]|nr:competence/damage-inducible protein A [Bryobacteraceae bacterium]
MNAAILAIGSEMLTPQRIDTNSLFVTDKLNTLGVEVVLKMVVGDDRKRLVQAMRHALSEAGLLIISGGLGPTEDDLTREAVADLTGRELIFRQEVVDWIAERFRRFNRPMAENNKRQGYVLDGAEILPNPNGTAPGQWLTHGGAHILLLPGPPGELKPMVENHCLPRLEKLLPPMVIRTRFYRVAGMGESDLDQLIAPVYKPFENPATTILAAPGDIQIHLRARCETETEAEDLLKKVGDPIAGLLGDRIYSRNGDPLETVAGRMLKERMLTLSVAESCTGGMLAERITSVPGASEYFAGGLLTYTNRAKQDLLGIDMDLIDEHGAVSEVVAKAMALGARERTGSKVALSVTGVAGPSQGEEKEPVGTVFVAIAHGELCTAKRLVYPGDRKRVRTMAVQAALDMLRRKLLT